MEILDAMDSVIFKGRASLQVRSQGQDDDGPSTRSGKSSAVAERRSVRSSNNATMSRRHRTKRPGYDHAQDTFIEKAAKMIEDIIREVEVGEIYQGKVVRIEKFGAFVELWAGQDGLVHIRNLAKERIAKVEDVVKLGDIITVKVIGVDDKGRVDLSRKAVLDSIK